MPDYPDLEGDEARRQIWLVDVPLAASHHLRNLINTGKPIPHEVIEKYEIPIVASVLKLYLLELPDSLVSSHVYEIVKTIYTTTAPNTSESARITVIQSTLGQLRLANIATLDAIITHFTRLIELTSAEEPYIAQLASTLAPCILRPKQENSLSMAEKFNVRLVRDLFAHKQAIFGELKRQSSLTHTNSGAQRPRAISTDESRRREHFEERQRAIIAAAEGRGRAPSPMRNTFGENSPTAHRRDRSASAQTRFPVAAPGAAPRDRNNRASLEVPSSPQRAPVGLQSPPKMNGTPLAMQLEQDDFHPRTTRERSDTNGTTIVTPGAGDNEMPDYMTHASGSGSNGDADSESNATTTSAASANTNDLDKRNSLSRSSAAGARPFRKATGGLQRQSLIGKRDSLSKRDSVGSVGTGSSIPASATSSAATGGIHGQIADKGEIVTSPVDVDDIAEAEGKGESIEQVSRGVELVDKPMDLD